mgnify:CR=1 FL=1
MKNYKEIEFPISSTIEDAVNILLGYKNKEVLAYGEFNGVMLYSDTVAMDNAYKQITGKTKKEFEEIQNKWITDCKRKEEEFKKFIPELTEILIEKGKKILTKDKWGYWAEIVPIRLNDLYQGMELGCCLDIVKILNLGGSFKRAKEKLNSQSHSGMSYSLVKAMVKEFCERGEEFVKYIS